MRTIERPADLTVAFVVAHEDTTPLPSLGVPFGLAITVEPPGLEALRVYWPSVDEAEHAAALARALPAANDLPPGTRLVVLDHARRERGILARVLPRKRVAPEDACAALLARGYVDIGRGLCPSGAGVLVLGRAPGSLTGAPLSPSS